MMFLSNSECSVFFGHPVQLNANLFFVNLIFLEPEPSDKEQEASEEIENEKEDSHEKEDSETVDNNEKEYESDDSVSWDTGYRKKSLGKLSVFCCFS